MMGIIPKKSKPVTNLKFFHPFLVELKVVYRNKGCNIMGMDRNLTIPSYFWGEPKGRMTIWLDLKRKNLCIACVLTWQSLWDTVDLAIAVAAPQILLPCVAQCVGGTFHWLTPAGAHGTPWYPQITLLFRILIPLCLNFELDKGIIYRKPSLLYRVKLHAFLRVNQSTKMHRTASIGYFRGKHWQVTSIVWSNKSVNPPC